MAEMPTAEPNEVPTEECGSGNKEQPCVCMNDNGTVVLLYTASGQMRYMVGLASSSEGDNWKVSFGRHQDDLGRGDRVRAAINEDNRIIVVYSVTSYLVPYCMYRLGTVNTDSKTIAWAAEAQSFASCSFNPNVALRNNFAVVVYDYRPFYGVYLPHYKICEIRENALWSACDEKLPDFRGCKELSVAIDSGCTKIVILSRSSIGRDLHYAVAKIEGIKIGKYNCFGSYGKGYYSDFALVNDSSIISVHQKWPWIEVKLQSAELGDNFHWKDEQKLCSGCAPTIAISQGTCRQIIVFVSGDYLQYRLRTLGSS